MSKIKLEINNVTANLVGKLSDDGSLESNYHDAIQNAISKPVGVVWE